MKHTIFNYLKDNYSSKYHFDGEPFSYDNLVWDDENSTKPTLQFLETKVEELNTEEPYKQLRMLRDKLLQETDKYGLSDYPFSSAANKTAWMAYRQALRDLTTSQTPELNSNWGLDLSSVIFPSKPE
jgi:hypothetical protein